MLTSLKHSPAEFLSQKYQNVDTRELVAKFNEAGFAVRQESIANLKRPLDPRLNDLFPTYEPTRQTELITKFERRNNRYLSRLGHENHYLRFASNELTTKAKGHDLFLRVSNSYDGSSSLKISLDILRLVCLNGMVAPRSIFEFSVKHNRKSIFDDALAATYKIIEKKEIIDEQIDKMSSTVLTQDQKIILIDKMVEFRYGKEHELILDPSKKLELLKPVRVEEKDDNLYQNFNTLQEKFTRGAKVNLVDAQGRPLTRQVREVKSQVTADSFNDSSWQYAVSLAS